MTALPDTAAAAAATADPDRALQELKDKRIALSAKLTSLLDSSVLQSPYFSAFSIFTFLPLHRPKYLRFFKTFAHCFA